MSSGETSLIDELISFEKQDLLLDAKITQKCEHLDSLYAQREAAISKFDEQITVLRQQERELAQEKKEVEHSIGSISVGAVLSELASTPEEWSQLWHERLKILWDRHGIEIPVYKDLAARLVHAREVITQLESAMPTLKGELGPLLVPPSSIELPIAFNRYQTRNIQGDHLYSRSDDWRVLVTLMGEESLAIGAQELIANNKYIVGGYDTRQMGATEYIALVHQGPHFEYHHYQKGRMELPALDRSTSTLLLKNYDIYKGNTFEGNGVAIATYDDHYDIHEGFLKWSTGYRPTVEI